MAQTKQGIKLKDYLRLMPLLKMFPKLKIGDLIDLNKKYPQATIEFLISIVEADFK